MSNIGAIIGEELGRKRAISFERFMELALYCPNSGYYECIDASPGRVGDFFTSVSVGSLFGELLAFQFGEWLKTMSGGGAQILEAGAHDGHLAKDILGWLQKHQPAILDTTEYWILEPSARRKEAQQKMLADFAGKVRWFDNWDALSADGVCGIIFSNELLDAMPVRRIGWDAAKQNWFEWGVTSDGCGLAWTKLPVSEQLAEQIASWKLPPELLRVLPDGFTTEIGAAATTWWRQAARSLTKGMLLAFDYGLTREEFFTPGRKDGTLRAYHRHHSNADLLARPGEQDITAQVDFTAIRSTGEAEGLKTGKFAAQSDFLTGIVQSISQSDPATAEWLSTRARAFQTLTHPEHLGRAFRVLLQTK